MNDLLKTPIKRLLRARYNTVIRDTFDDGLDGWDEDGDWHKVTVESNEDKSSGLTGGLALDCAGSYEGGTMEKEIEVDNYSEIVFEHYVQNPNPKESPNYLRFYVDDQLQLEIKGASPWQRCEPIGITPGKHLLKFEYEVDEEEGKKAIVDTFTVYEAKDVAGLVQSSNPATPVKKVANQNILRGFSAYMENVEADTKIDITMAFKGIEMQDFLLHHDSIYYFLDEFGICYRGIFPDSIKPKTIAVNSFYLVDLEMICNQRTAKGFC